MSDAQIGGLALTADGRLVVSEAVHGAVHVYEPADRETGPGRLSLYDNGWLAGAPLSISSTDATEIEWSDLPTSPGRSFSARWGGHVRLEGRWHRLMARAEGGMRLWVDDLLVVDAWDESSVSRKLMIPAVEAEAPLRIEYTDSTLPASVDLAWQPAAAADRVYLPALPSAWHPDRSDG